MLALCNFRSMLQVDLRKRPRVENLECIPGIEVLDSDIE